MANSIATRWRELSGENEWEGLLQPLDTDLRQYIIHYGQRTTAVGDLFDPNTCGPKTSKEQFFTEACLIKGNPYKYEVTDFIYAGSDDVESAWIGYVAVSTDEGSKVLGRRDVLVAWRGTRTLSEWINDLRIPRVSPTDLFPKAAEYNALVHGGFHSLYIGTVPASTHSKTSARGQVLTAVKKLVKKYKQEELSITVTGFSLGGALATLTAMDIVANGCNKPTGSKAPFMVTAFVFGCPRVGNDGFKQLFDSLRDDNLRLLRMKNKMDFVPVLLLTGYTDVGNELNVNTSVSKYLKEKIFGFIDDAFPEDDPEAQEIIISGWINNLYSCHNMDVYMHGVAIENIAEVTPAGELDYDLPLVNKHLDRVKDDYGFPPEWWVGENRKKMEQMDNGRWRRKRIMASSIATRWRELGGYNNWGGLLHPLDTDLRRYIIHYGHRTAAARDLFDPNTSKQEFSPRLVS
ncbi:phospholipase A1-II 1-like [Gossypium australe]|uniref:Phospholipase A1 n=1 Tax=Gossypium australe TaxID=47621 RepID=A0A5B6VR90_9ROSI|nr:phospholipase A1-II 1-like [Gossypium australe]